MKVAASVHVAEAVPPDPCATVVMVMPWRDRPQLLGATGGWDARDRSHSGATTGHRPSNERTTDGNR
jgi:hypothetical protein